MRDWAENEGMGAGRAPGAESQEAEVIPFPSIQFELC
jgi:hypothetical protein